MAAETTSPNRPRRWRPWRRPLALATALLLAGCYAQRPKSEPAPSAAPVAPQPPPPPPAAEPAGAAPREAESAVEIPPEIGSSTPGAKPSSAPRGAPPERSRRASQRPGPEKRKAASAIGSQAADESPGGTLGSGESSAAELRSQLDRAYGAASPDCPTARDRKKAVCDLASQICQLTDRDPNVASVAEYCDEAKRRCTQAERRTVERCPE